MTRRSALLAGLAVMFVLLGGQVYGSWLRRPVIDSPTLSSAQRAAEGRTPSPAATSPSPGTADADAAPTTTPATSPAAPPARKPPGGGGGKYAAMGVKLVTGETGIALTFDDGPHPAFTPQVLELLRANKVHAVFCVIGSEVRRYPHLVAQIARDGHTLCNHSWRHEIGLGKQPAATIRANLERTNAEIHRAAPGAKIPYFRQPGGAWTRAGVKVARELGMTSLGWTVDPRDWEKPSAKVIKARVLAGTRPGSVILLHDAGGDRAATIAACRSLIPALKRRHQVTLLV